MRPARRPRHRCAAEHPVGDGEQTAAVRLKEVDLGQVMPRGAPLRESPSRMLGCAGRHPSSARAFSFDSGRRTPSCAPCRARGGAAARRGPRSAATHRPSPRSPMPSRSCSPDDRPRCRRCSPAGRSRAAIVALGGVVDVNHGSRPRSPRTVGRKRRRASAIIWLGHRIVRTRRTGRTAGRRLRTCRAARVEHL